MKTVKTIFRLTASILLAILAAVAVLSISPIYEFAPARPFSGDLIYNPYAALDTCTGWKRACFHTHTKVDKGINECPEYPDIVHDHYSKYGYDILGFANHQALTPHPYADSLYIGSYEHGYNLFKFHLIPFGAEQVRRFDHPLPFLRSQKQFMIDLLAKDGDMVQLNHPARTNTVDTRTMQALTGYRLIEADAGFGERDSGAGTRLTHWDEALSAGRYCHNILNDDNHDPKRLSRIARRCSWINTSSAQYENLLPQLLAGNFYSTRIPNYGDGDINVKIRENLSLPFIKDIGLRQDTVFMTLSSTARRIEVISQDGAIVNTATDTDYVEYIMRPEDPYIRLTAHFEDGFTIYTNAFARYPQGCESPYKVLSHPVRWGATILFNLALLVLASAAVYAIYRIFRKK